MAACVAPDPGARPNIGDVSRELARLAGATTAHDDGPIGSEGRGVVAGAGAGVGKVLGCSDEGDDEEKRWEQEADEEVAAAVDSDVVDIGAGVDVDDVEAKADDGDDEADDGE